MTGVRWLALALGLVLVALAAGAWLGYGCAARQAAEVAARTETEWLRRHAELASRTATLAVRLDEARAFRAEADRRTEAAEAALEETRRARDRRDARARARHTPAERAVALAEAVGAPATAARPTTLDGAPAVVVTASVAAELHVRAVRAETCAGELAALGAVADAQRARADAAVTAEGLAVALAGAHRTALDDALHRPPPDPPPRLGVDLPVGARVALGAAAVLACGAAAATAPEAERLRVGLGCGAGALGAAAILW